MGQGCEEWQEVMPRDSTVPQEVPGWDGDQGTGPHQERFPTTLSTHQFSVLWCLLMFWKCRLWVLGFFLIFFWFSSERKSLILGLRLGQSLRDQYVYSSFMYLWLVLVSALKHQQQILGVCEALRHFLSVFLWHSVWIMQLEIRLGIKVSLSQLSEFWPQVQYLALCYIYILTSLLINLFISFLTGG